MLTPEELKKEIQSIENPPRVLLDTPESFEYNNKRLTFNRRFSKRPAAIVLCTTTAHVAHVVKIAGQNKEYPLRVKSGGHDHEAECSATDAIVIDFCDMNIFNVDSEKLTVTVEPGLQFRHVIPSLDQAGVSIPHGTCESVGIFGFTLGGGWGPWTRLHGMCCEHLIEATIVLGDGSIRNLNETREEDKELLWALKGGGGFSFGIVTEMVIRAFKQPAHTLRFSLEWEGQKEYLPINPDRNQIAPALEILEAWENVIAPDQNKQLIGTNLKIMAIPKDDKTIKKSIHDCTFYGYYAGTEEALKNDLNEWFKGLPWTKLTITTSDNKDHTFSSWDRISTHNAKLKLRGDMPQHFPPDLDFAAPHKLSSRLVQEGGLGAEGRENLIKSLRSDLISIEGEMAHLHTYVTLGAISGHFYNEVYDYPSYPNGSSFPYKKRPYTIQYQAWWNEEEIDKTIGEIQHVYNYVNESMDWIAECRTNHFPETNGSFISFKDSSIPTHTYFLESYEKLKQIKRAYCKDENNLFRSRKTII